jgi:hypothetical protein
MAQDQQTLIDIAGLIHLGVQELVLTQSFTRKPQRHPNTNTMVQVVTV